MLNALNLAGCVSPLLLNLMVLAFSFLARRQAIITNSPKSKVLCVLFGRLSFILIQSNARAIPARSGLVLDWEVDPE